MKFGAIKIILLLIHGDKSVIYILYIIIYIYINLYVHIIYFGHHRKPSGVVESATLFMVLTPNITFDLRSEEYES